MKKHYYHYKCSSCGIQLTEINEDGLPVMVKRYYNFDRYNHHYYTEIDGNDDIYIFEDREMSNHKASRVVCLDCMDKMLTESETFRKLFYVKGLEQYVY